VTIIDRIRPRRPAAPAPPPEATPLERRRAELAERVAELQFDLGGLAYEMAIRDHFRLDVLLRRAAELQQADGELGEVDRLLRLERSAETGSCEACGAPHSRGAVFCWQCGASLMPAS
jgi:hypothetical protein